jgi:predicted acylesterase/phospholipase RssA
MVQLQWPSYYDWWKQFLTCCLVCGTSAGGLLAVGILCGRDTATFSSFVDSFARDIFDVPLWREAIRFITRESRYSQTRLQKLIHDNFETSEVHSMSDLDQRISPRMHGFVVSTLANQCQWRPFLFRTYSHEGSILRLRLRYSRHPLPRRISLR